MAIQLPADEPDEAVADSGCVNLRPSFKRALLSIYVPIDLFRHEFQKILFGQEAVFSRKRISRIRQFLDDRVP